MIGYSHAEKARFCSMSCPLFATNPAPRHTSQDIFTGYIVIQHNTTASAPHIQCTHFLPEHRDRTAASPVHWPEVSSPAPRGQEPSQPIPDRLTMRQLRAGIALSATWSAGRHMARSVVQAALVCSRRC